MTHMDHLRRAVGLVAGEDYAATRFWVAPTTRIDRDTLKEEGVFATFVKVGARMETPGCSLCMGNQARVRPGATVYSTSTRNFNNRLGDGAKVYLGSTEIATMVALTGKLPDVEQYFSFLERKGQL